MDKFPENFSRLEMGESSIYKESVEAIEADRNLLFHLDLAERAMDLLDMLARTHPAKDKDEETLQLLCIRIFNGLASGIRLFLAGYYQTAALQQRDILETVFLLDFFSSNKGAIQVWRESDKKTRMTKFKPIEIRKFLDKRDGFKEQKRAKAYAQFCDLAGHATFEGFAMITPEGLGAHCGPFFEKRRLKALIEEHAKLVAQAGTIALRLLPTKRLSILKTKLHFMECQSEWAEKYYAKKSNLGPLIEDLKLFIQKAEEAEVPDLIN